MRDSSIKRFAGRTVILSITLGVLAVGLLYRSGWNISSIQTLKSSVFQGFNERFFNRYECLSVKVNSAFSDSLQRVDSRPQQHVAFVKVHKSASSTLQNVFYRYGITRNLSFALPKDKDQLRFSIARGWHAPLIPPPGGATKYDILANHAVFDEKIFRSVLHDDTTYIAIMREPTKNFISGVLYFTYKYPQPYLRKIPKSKLFSELIRHPEKTEPKNLRATFTYNMQANDLGFTLSKIQRVADRNVTEYLEKLNRLFSLVLISDHFDESIVLMKRYLNWGMKDILFINVNEFSRVPPPNLTRVERKILRDRNYLDYMFYDYFYKRFWRQISCENIELMEEVAFFKILRAKVEQFCKEPKSDEYFVPASKWSAAFLVSTQDCRYMLTSELDFFTNLQQIQRARVKKIRVI